MEDKIFSLRLELNQLQKKFQEKRTIYTSLLAG
jgi:hypothetical protein